MDFFLINFQFSHVSYSYCNLSHMDGSLYHCFCVILIDCIVEGCKFMGVVN